MYALVAQLVEQTAVKNTVTVRSQVRVLSEAFLYFPLNKYLFSENYTPVLKSVFF